MWRAKRLRDRAYTARVRLADGRVRLRKPGKLTDAERSTIAGIVNAQAIISTDQVQALAIGMNRSIDTIKRAIVNARLTLQQNAQAYVDLHLQTAQSALADRDYDTARKASEYAIDRIAARDENGSIERIVDHAIETPQAPRVHIGIALAGIPALRKVP